MTKKENPHHGSSLDSFLKEEGVLEQFRAAAVKGGDRLADWQGDEGQAVQEQDGGADAHQPRAARPAARSGAGQRNAGDPASRGARARPGTARGAT